MLDVSQRQSLGAASGGSSLRCACLNSCSYHGTVFDKRSSTVYHHGIGVCTDVGVTNKIKRQPGLCFVASDGGQITQLQPTISGLRGHEARKGAAQLRCNEQAQCPRW